MKKIFSIIIVIAIASPFFTACKKGENDPGISLKSRTARLVGEWVLKEMESNTTRTYSAGGSSTETVTFNGTTKTTTNSNGSTTSTYSESIEILKDGTYKTNYKEIEESVTRIYEGNGTWAWVDGNKEDEYKNKERVCFTTTSYTSTTTVTGFSSTSTYSSNGDEASVSVMRINKLSSKELIIKREFNYNYDGDTYTLKETYTYEKQ